MTDPPVLLVQLDGKLPNIALMRLAAAHRKLGRDVEIRHWRRPEQCMRELGMGLTTVYGSAIFERTKPVVDALRKQFPTATIGGTGSGSPITVEMAGVSSLAQDYSIYPDERRSIGFTQRGCRLRCQFCVVPEKEGRVLGEQQVGDIWRGDPWPRELLLLDNDFFGQHAWRARVREIVDGGFKVSFAQGINIRMIGEEEAEALAEMDCRDDSMRTRRIYTAWDNKGDEERVFRGLRLLADAGVSPDDVMVYTLIGYWPGETAEDRDYRRQRLRDFGARPYPMPFERTPELVGFQRWVVGAYDKRVPWAEWQAAGYRPERLGLTRDARDGIITACDSRH